MNVYSNPVEFGLAQVAEIDYSSSQHEFDIRAVWRHVRSGGLYTARDAGPSGSEVDPDSASFDHPPFDRLRSFVHPELRSVDIDELRREATAVATRERAEVNPEDLDPFLHRVEAALMSARTTGNLLGVKVIELHGWAGKIEVETWFGPGEVVIEAPRRQAKESWRFQRQKTADGVLRCYSSLLGTPDLAAGGPELTMIVRLPADAVGAIDVRLA